MIWRTDKPKLDTVAVVATEKHATIYPNGNAGSGAGIALAQFFRGKWRVIPTGETSEWEIITDAIAWMPIENIPDTPGVAMAREIRSKINKQT